MTGIPLDALVLRGVTTIGIDAQGAGRTVEVVAQPDGSVAVRGTQDLAPFSGPDRLVDAVRAFWQATGPGMEYAELAQQGARPPLARIAVAGPLTYELTFADRTPPTRIDVDAQGQPAYADPVLPPGMDLGLLGMAVSMLHRVRTRDAQDAIAPVVARSVAEAGAYLEMALPERDGFIDFRRDVRVVPVGPHESQVRFDGRYAGRRLQLAVIVPPGDPGFGAAFQRYVSYGIGLSTLLDAGQWLDLEVQYALEADERFARLDGGEPDDAAYNAILQALRLADAAGEELAKQLPPGADTVPDEQLWSARGRAARSKSPHLFTRDAVEAARASNRARLDAFVERYGPGRR